MKKKNFIALFIAAFSYLSVMAQKPAVVIGDKPGWYKIAERHVSFKADHDEIRVLGNDHFQQIKLRVKDAPVYLTNFLVYYEGDDMQTIEVNTMLSAGEETVATNV